MKKPSWGNPFEIRPLTLHSDERGNLFEVLRFLDEDVPGQGQLYTFTINPGHRRGDHFHEHKREWFTCVWGCAEILLTGPDEHNLACTLSANDPTIIYVAPGTAHALINRQETPTCILSYASKQHDPEDEDTYIKIAFEDYIFWDSSPVR